MNRRETVSFIWSVAELIRDTCKRGKYHHVILPLTALRDTLLPRLISGELGLTARSGVAYLEGS